MESVKYIGLDVHQGTISVAAGAGPGFLTVCTTEKLAGPGLRGGSKPGAFEFPDPQLSSHGVAGYRTVADPRIP